MQSRRALIRIGLLAAATLLLITGSVAGGPLLHGGVGPATVGAGIASRMAAQGLSSVAA